MALTKEQEKETQAKILLEAIVEVEMAMEVAIKAATALKKKETIELKTAQHVWRNAVSSL